MASRSVSLLCHVAQLPIVLLGSARPALAYAEDAPICACVCPLRSAAQLSRARGRPSSQSVEVGTISARDARVRGPSFPRASCVPGSPCGLAARALCARGLQRFETARVSPAAAASSVVVGGVEVLREADDRRRDAQCALGHARGLTVTWVTDGVCLTGDRRDPTGLGHQRAGHSARSPSHATEAPGSDPPGSRRAGSVAPRPARRGTLDETARFMLVSGGNHEGTEALSSRVRARARRRQARRTSAHPQVSINLATFPPQDRAVFLAGRYPWPRRANSRPAVQNSPPAVPPGTIAINLCTPPRTAAILNG